MTDQTVSKHRRQKHNKRKTGCKPCKAKHIRCGEEEPTCLNCANKGLQCFGRDKFRQSPIIQPLYLHMEQFRNSFVYGSPSSSFNPLEQRALYFFRNQTLQLLCAVFPSQIWARALLAVTQSVPAIKDIVISISAYHLSQHPGMKNSHSAMLYALQNYTKATQSMRAMIDSEKPPMTIIKLACIIFIIFESLRGERKAIVSHLSIGIRLLNYSRYSAKLDDFEDDFEKDIDRTLSRISLIHSLYNLHGNSQFPVLICVPEPLVDSTGFSTISDARASMMHLCKLSFQFRRKMEEQNSPSHRDLSVLAEQNQLRSQYQDWLDKVDHIALDTEEDKKAIELLKASHMTSYISLLTSPTQYQTSFDQYNAMFRSAIDMLDMVVDSLLLPSREPMLFSVHLGIIPCLFYIVIKCRHPQMRRRALSILRKAPQREVLWDAKQTAMVAEQVIKFEEHRLKEGQHEKYYSIPEEDRVNNVDIRETHSRDNEASFCIILKRRPYATCANLEESYVYI